MTDSSAVKVYALALVLGLGLILTGCSSGPTAVQQQTEALRQVQTVTRDANAVYRAEGEYAQDVQAPCPSNLTPGTLPGYDCGGPAPLTSDQLRQVKDAIPKARAQLAADERACLAFLDGMKNDKAGKYTFKKSNCQISPADNEPNQAPSSTTLSACTELLSATSARMPTAHPASVILQPPALITELKESGSPMLTKAATELSSDALANKAIQEASAMNRATAYCRGLEAQLRSAGRGPGSPPCQV